MTERPRRPILHLKLNPDRPPPIPAVPAAPVKAAPARPAKPAAPALTGEVWKCKPCGAAIALADMPLEGDVRCPGCNARLGKAEDFRADPPRTERLRARLYKR
ncbi:MAG: hypothetical protein ACK4YQ_00770 [Phenylobacterium sp.]|uniref:hypothetical protein n=1 Tax=Phenylobacterium sp. TaxID=1871053 RepID=UPI003918B9B1